MVDDCTSNLHHHHKQLQIAAGVTVTPLWLDEGREVYRVSSSDGSTPPLAIKYWDATRLAHSGEQVFNELRARMSTSLSSCTYVVVPLHITTSREGGMLMVYPYAGTSMASVCSGLRAAGGQGREDLVGVLARMSTSVLLMLQKLQAHKPKALVHRDIKLANLLLGDDRLVRLADFGSLSEQGSPATSHDPTYFPPDLAALLPAGRHVFEDPASLSAANSLLLDLRGLGLALIEGYAGHLPAEVAALGEGGQHSTTSCDVSAGGGSSSGSCDGGGTSATHTAQPAADSNNTGSSTSTTQPNCNSSSASSLFDAQERARLLRIAHHDWAASIDALIPVAEAPTLNAFAKLLLGPAHALLAMPTPPAAAGACLLARLLQHPLIKPVHRAVLDTARRARKPWTARLAGCRAAVAQVMGPLLRLEQQQLTAQHEYGVRGALDSLPALSEQFELLAEQFADQQQQQQEQEGQQEEQGQQEQEGQQEEEQEQGTVSTNFTTSSIVVTVPSAPPAAPTATELQAALSAVLSQLSAARPDAAAHIQQLHQELLLLAAGTSDKQQQEVAAQIQQAVGVPGMSAAAATGVAASQTDVLLQPPVTPTGSSVVSTQQVQQDDGDTNRSAASSGVFGCGGSNVVLVAHCRQVDSAFGDSTPTAFSLYSPLGGALVSDGGGGGDGGAGGVGCATCAKRQCSHSWGMLGGGVSHAGVPACQIAGGGDACDCCRYGVGQTSPLAGQADWHVEVAGGGGAVGECWGPASSTVAGSVCSEKSVAVDVEVLVVDSAPAATKPAVAAAALVDDDVKNRVGRVGGLWGAASDMFRGYFATG